jgi:hypothetical protein
MKPSTRDNLIYLADGLKRFLVSLLPFRAASRRDRVKPPGDVRMLDPKEILFSLPTLCDPAPEVEASSAPSGTRRLHEDDWRQIEFVSASNRDHIQSELAALASFKRQHQKGAGWTGVYIRKEHPKPLTAIGLQYSVLPPFSTSSVTLSGRFVRGGFALSDGGEWFIYGQQSSDGRIVQLAVSPGRSACSERFAAGLVQITQHSHVLLVDWYAGSIVDVASPDSVLTWVRRFQM